MSYSYPVNLNIDYSTNAQYRVYIRQIFNMDASNYPVMDSTIDDESKDENEYDETASVVAMDWILNITQHSPLIQELYVLAAGKVLSTTPDIGLAILLSYDYLFYFHPILVQWIIDPNGITMENEWMMELRKKL